MVLVTFLSRSLPAIGGFQPRASVVRAILPTTLRSSHPFPLPPTTTTRTTTTDHRPRFRTFATGMDDDESTSAAAVTPTTGTASEPPELSPWATGSFRTDIDDDGNDVVTPGKVNKSRFRQHVNPLARKFQMPTELAEDWPNDGSFGDATLPLHIDIGCGKAGFLLTLAAQRRPTPTAPPHPTLNYLGLEIRPTVATYARSRIPKHNLHGTVDVLGCNANVDLPRILRRYTSPDGGKGGTVKLVSVQFPDPHFKKRHGKRRVVTKELVGTLAEFMEEGAEVFFAE